MKSINFPNCPACHSSWVNTCYSTSIWEEYDCQNREQCRTTYYKGISFNRDTYYIRRRFNKHTIWWGANTGCEIEMGSGLYETINAELPFDIDNERLKLLLLLG
jgi:hypothetical protein